MSNKDKKPQLSEKGAAKHFKTSAATMPSDQIYRELVMNSIEACKKAKKINPDFKGKIMIGKKKIEHLPIINMILQKRVFALVPLGECLDLPKLKELAMNQNVQERMPGKN